MPLWKGLGRRLSSKRRRACTGDLYRVLSRGSCTEHCCRLLVQARERASTRCDSTFTVGDRGTVLRACCSSPRTKHVRPAYRLAPPTRGMNEESVSFRWKDYANGCRRRIITLSAIEFLRRFLLHSLPKGFVRIRYYGFLANRCRKQKVEQCRQLLALREQSEIIAVREDETTLDPVRRPQPCPCCGRGTLRRVAILDPSRAPPVELPPVGYAA